MNFKSYLDSIGGEYGILDIQEDRELGIKYKDSINEIANKNRRNGSYVGYFVDVDRKLINLIFERKLVVVNYLFEVIHEKRIY